MNNTHLETLKAELKALEETSKVLTAEAGAITFKQGYNKKRIKLVKEEIAAAEQIAFINANPLLKINDEMAESSVETLVKITEK